ncbi:MAG: hypothetical protein LBR61_12210 [Synergistaceae bacterium]|nr:hypothetical protein [Synergistaceae bacterium]
MLDYQKIFELPVFGMKRDEKDAFFRSALSELTDHHRDNCEAYRRITDVAGRDSPLPVRLFKEYELLSVPREAVIKTMTSSGTTGQAVSRIFLDRDTSARQSKALSKIVSQFIGKTRLPMLIVDSPAVLKDRNMFSARGAGILGFSMLGRDLTWALDENMEPDMTIIDNFSKKHEGENVLLFGFTFMIWQHFIQALVSREETLAFEGILVHGGGWKKMADQSVDNERFKQTVRDVTGIGRVCNYYGMVEQTGSIFMECEQGHLHASVFSDIRILDGQNFAPVEQKRGLIECASLLPTSYPGHRLLTEDEGELLGVDDCPCGRAGKYFRVYGRVKGAEIRGCSDTYERR